MTTKGRKGQREADNDTRNGNAANPDTGNEPGGSQNGEPNPSDPESSKSEESEESDADPEPEAKSKATPVPTSKPKNESESVKPSRRSWLWTDLDGN